MADNNKEDHVDDEMMEDDDEMEDIEEEGEDGEDDKMGEESGETKVYLPGDPIAEGEELVCDESAYIMYHQAQTGNVYKDFYYFCSYFIEMNIDY
jgi:ribosome assembly protein RRB1